MWCVGIIYQGVVKKQWQKSKKIKKNRGMILHLIQPTKLAYFRVKIQHIKLFDNQENKKQCYFLIYFSEKKMKTDLKKRRSDRGKSAVEHGFFAKSRQRKKTVVPTFDFLFKLNTQRKMRLSGIPFKQAQPSGMPRGEISLWRGR